MKNQKENETKKPHQIHKENFDETLKDWGIPFQKEFRFLMEGCGVLIYVFQSIILLLKLKAELGLAEGIPEDQVLLKIWLNIIRQQQMVGWY